MYNIINEGKAVINVPKAKKVSKEMPVFYNPVMKLNRDISILLLNSIDKNNLAIADPLAGTGTRSIRFLLELSKDKIKTISINDYSSNAFELIKNNLLLNKIKINDKIIIKNEDANLFLLNSTGFDYIDIDPFGTPAPFLDSAVKRIARQGILAITATDTGCLCGSFPKACIRKYWAAPKKSTVMHETGLRILIRKVQLIGAEHEKALTPIFSYSREHYFRVFFNCEKGKEKADKIMKQHGLYNEAGPMWLGQLWDTKLASKMLKNNEIEENKRFLSIINEESKINTIGFYNIHKIVKKYKLKKIPNKELLMQKIKEAGYKAANTHFSDISIRSGMPLKKLIDIIKKSVRGV